MLLGTLRGARLRHARLLTKSHSTLDTLCYVYLGLRPPRRMKAVQHLTDGLPQQPDASRHTRRTVSAGMFWFRQKPSARRCHGHTDREFARRICGGMVPLGPLALEPTCVRPHRVLRSEPVFFRVEVLSTQVDSCRNRKRMACHSCRPKPPHAEACS